MSMSKSEAGRLGGLASKKYAEELHNIYLSEYLKNPNKCKKCEIDIPYDKRVNSFCSSSCSASHNNKTRAKVKPKFNCLNCNKEFVFKKTSKNKYCNNLCQQSFQYKAYIESWKNGNENGEKGKGQVSKYIKRYLLDKFQNSCSCCKISSWNEKPIVLEVEHIDGNSDNNLEDNLTILCPNCHSQTNSYKGANRGSGRAYRRERYKQGKSY